MLVTDDDKDTALLRGMPAINARSISAQPSSSSAGHDLWRNYWRSQRQPWRTEAEIEKERQLELDRYKAARPATELARYPFTGVRLRRADIEWLLASDGDHLDAANLGDGSQSATEGLDLRGADLRKGHLGGLPLTGMQGGLLEDEWLLASDTQRELAAVHLERTDLRGAHLEGAVLCGAHLEEADLRDAHLEGADLSGAHLSGANFARAHLEGAVLCQAHLEGVRNFPKPANLRGACFDSATRLEGVTLGDEQFGHVRLADVHWGNVNLAVVDWAQIDRLGDEDEIQWQLPVEYQYAIRANHQVAAALQAQGLRADADYFAYRAHVCQCFMRPHQAILPIVLRVFVRERMPLPKVLLRLEERRQGQRMPRHPLRIALLWLLPLLSALIAMALLEPLLLVALLAVGILLFLAVLPTMRKRRLRPLEYKRSQEPLPPPGLQSQRRRRRQQWLLLLGFLLGMPKSQLPLLLAPGPAGFLHMPLPGRIESRLRNHPVPAMVFAALLILLLLIDDTLLCYGRFIFSLVPGVLAGYGYKPLRSVCWYVVVVSGCAALYYAFGHLAMQSAFMLSLTSFHGYGFFVGNQAIAWGAKVEAVIGLVIEVSFVVTLMRSLLSK